MCDLDTIYGILLGANILLIASIAACGVAIALNLNIFTFWSAPAAFGLALAAGLAANIALLPVTGMIAACSAGQCSDMAKDAALAFGTAAGSLATGIGASYIATLTSAVPIAGAAAMGLYATFLVATTVFLLQAILTLQKLQACLAVPAPATSSAIVLTGGGAIFLTGIGIVIFALFFIRGKK